MSIYGIRGLSGIDRTCGDTIGVNYKKFGVSEDIIDIGTGSSKFLKILTG